ncbi:MAG: class I SAM-dependent methyltransferase [Christensenellaceae bacterium]|jgi:tRNA (adenine22-N1)-methyltransferase|nr:class I SAM-dependent methyltransferase [Christensenellaceae bacterium]
MARPGPRLLAARDLLGPCRVFADIGANHGFLAAEMLKSGLCERAIVSDISAQALERARRTMAETGLLGRAEFIVTDGLQGIALSGEDAAAICGMGARTIMAILQDGLPCAAVLQANVELPLLRHFLAERHYLIEAERIARDAGRYYPLLRVLPGGGERYSTAECVTGKRERLQNPELRRGYLQWRLAVCEVALKGANLGQDAGKRERAQAEWLAVREALEEEK